MNWVFTTYSDVYNTAMNVGTASAIYAAPQKKSGLRASLKRLVSRKG